MKHKARGFNMSSQMKQVKLCRDNFFPFGKSTFVSEVRKLEVCIWARAIFHE